MEGTFEKLKILSEGAKYDVSCSSSGVARSNKGKIGSSTEAGICHSWAADGRCISLLKILFSNDCMYNCEYCVNRRTADVKRASFEPDELARLTIEFYRRNYIEGLFLSSAVMVSPDYTAERIRECLYLLRHKYGFSGYIHAKVIPGVAKELLEQIGFLADRLSVNIELPSKESLQMLAPQKTPKNIFEPMKQINYTLAERRQLKGPGTMFKNKDIYSDYNFSYLNPMGDNISIGDGSLSELTGQNSIIKEEKRTYNEKFAPAGQTTQMIIGATNDSDLKIIKTSESLYKTFKMKRVYFSAYIPAVESKSLPSRLAPPQLLREHRLYQADWLLRFYSFTADEIVDQKNPFLDLDLDPKISWALRNIKLFPIEINKASLDELLRIPGIGTISAMRILRQRRFASIQYDDLKKMGVVIKRAKYFLTCRGKYYGNSQIEPEIIKNNVLSEDNIKISLLPINDNAQISMFDYSQSNLLGSNSLSSTREKEGEIFGLSV